MEMKLELVLLPVADVDRAKAFYEQRAGFDVDVDHRAGSDFRVVQLTPPGSACSITFGVGITSAAPGSVRGLHLVVTDIVAARDELVGRDVAVGEVRHIADGEWVSGPHPNAATTSRSPTSQIPTGTRGSCRNVVTCADDDSPRAHGVNGASEHDLPKRPHGTDHRGIPPPAPARERGTPDLWLPGRRDQRDRGRARPLRRTARVRPGTARGDGRVHGVRAREVDGRGRRLPRDLRARARSTC